MSIYLIAGVISFYWTMLSLQNRTTAHISMKVIAAILWFVIFVFYFIIHIHPLNLLWVGIILYVSQLFYIKVLIQKAEDIKKSNIGKVKYIKDSSKG